MRYQLQKYTNPASRHTCPACGKKREFTFYIDTHTGEILNEQYGICNRKDKCGYHLSPYHKNASGESYANFVWQNERNVTNLCEPKHDIKPVKKAFVEKVYIDKEVAEKTHSEAYFAKNSLFNFALGIAHEQYQKELVKKVFLGYKVGTCSAGAIFWFCDLEGRYHAGQVKEFSHETGKTLKTDWVHSVLARQNVEWAKKYYEQDEKVGCLFGEHLLALPENQGKTIVLVESPKNAILCQIFLPKDDFLCLATYSLSAFTPARCMSVIGRKILLLPDLGRGTEIWKQTAPNFLPEGSYDFFDILETIATDSDKKEGKDIADFIIKEQLSIIPHEKYLSKLGLENGVLLFKDADGCYPASWDIEANYITTQTKTHLLENTQ